MYLYALAGSLGFHARQHSHQTSWFSPLLILRQFSNYHSNLSKVHRFRLLRLGLCL